MPGILAIQDGEVALVSQEAGVLAQNAIANRVERSAPERRHFLPEQLRHAPHHFLCRLVREREEQNPVGRDPLFQQIRHPVGERARLARARPAMTREGPGGEVTTASCCSFNSRA